MNNPKSAYDYTAFIAIQLPEALGYIYNNIQYMLELPLLPTEKKEATNQLLETHRLKLTNDVKLYIDMGPHCLQ